MQRPDNEGTSIVLVPGDPPESDAALIAASAIDPQRFGEIFDRHAPHIHRYLARRLGRESADDLLAIAFEAAFRRRRTYRVERTDARPWLYGIAAHVISQHRREEVRRLRLLAAVAPALDDPGHASEVAERVSAQALRPDLMAALAGLTGGDREVLLLIAWEDLSYAEVAFALDIPLGTVRSRLNRARRITRAALASAIPDLVPDPTIEELLRNG